LIDLSASSVIVTGGTGSFGRAFCRALLSGQRPRRLIVFSRDELKQYEMSEDPFFARHADVMRYFIGDVRDSSRLAMAFRGVDYVIHAAALKQVSAAEYNPFECIKTNVYGAENVVSAAIHAGVKRVVALSTDKAANPINLYGASKLASDKIFVAAKHLVGAHGPLFTVVRYGNVMGSRGSVIPFFLRLANAGGETKVPITDRRMTRFWITLPEGVDFVLSSLAMMKGSEIFVPKIPSMRIVDLAEWLAPGLALDEIGIRPGEKLHETMITQDDARMTLELDDRFVIQPALYGEPKRGYADNESPVAEAFSYSSDTNSQWLTREALTRILDVGRPPNIPR